MIPFRGQIVTERKFMKVEFTHDDRVWRDVEIPRDQRETKGPMVMVEEFVTTYSYVAPSMVTIFTPVKGAGHTNIMAVCTLEEPWKEHLAGDVVIVEARSIRKCPSPPMRAE